MDIWKKILGQNWAFYSHQKLYDMVRTEATGASAVTDADQTWREFTDMMGRSRENIGRLLNDVGAAWQGLASESMRSGVTPLAQWTDDARTAGTASSGSVRQVGEAFSFAASAMPEPVRVTSTANSDFGGIPASFTHLFGGQTDQDRQERAAAQAKQRAVELMQGYSRNADSAASSVGTFVPPQPVTVNVAPPQTSASSVGYPSSRQPGTPTPSPASGNDDPRATGGSYGPRPDRIVAPLSNPPGQLTTPGATSPATESPGLAPLQPRSGPPPGGTGQTPTGRPPGASGRSDGERGHAGRGLTGSVPEEGERVVGARGATGMRGGTSGGVLAPVGAGTGSRGEQDREHNSPDYLRTYHDFWDDLPSVAPPAIGEADGGIGTDDEGDGGAH